MEKISKTEAERKIKEFFSDIENKSPKEIKKIKRAAMSQNIPLKNLRKKFCKECYSPDLKVVGVKSKIKVLECNNCKNLMRWKIKN